MRKMAAGYPILISSILMAVFFVLSSSVLSSSILIAAESSPCGFVNPTVCETNTDAEGIAAMTGRPAGDYCEEALFSAKSRAVGKALGTYVSDETNLVDETMLQSNSMTSMSGFVTCSRVTKEWSDEGGVYHVKIEARVTDQNTRDAIKKITPDDSIIVLLNEKNMGAPMEDPYIVNAVITALVDEGYVVKDMPALLSVLERDKEMAATRGDKATLQDMSFRFLSKIVLTGAVTTEKGQDFKEQGLYPGDNLRYSAHARMVARAVIQDNANILCNLDLDEKGFGPTWEKAGQNALKKLSESAGAEIVNKCAVKAKEDARWIDIIVKGLPDRKSADRVRDVLTGMPWQKQVEVELFDTEASKYRLLYPANVTNVVYRLDAKKYLKVTSYSEDRIVAVYNEEKK